MPVLRLRTARPAARVPGAGKELFEMRRKKPFREGLPPGQEGSPLDSPWWRWSGRDKRFGCRRLVSIRIQFQHHRWRRNIIHYQYTETDNRIRTLWSERTPYAFPVGQRSVVQCAQRKRYRSATPVSAANENKVAGVQCRVWTCSPWDR